MYSVQEICEEQERQYNQLMQEDGQYCHPESFKWGFEHGFDYALTKAGWHPASEPPKDEEEVIAAGDYSTTRAVFHEGKYYIAEYYHNPEALNCALNGVKWWCYPPKCYPPKEDSL